MTTYFDQNNEFLPTMVNLWGVSWEVHPLEYPIANLLSAKLFSSRFPDPKYVKSAVGKVVDVVPSLQ